MPVMFTSGFLFGEVAQEENQEALTTEAGHGASSQSPSLASPFPNSCLVLCTPANMLIIPLQVSCDTPTLEPPMALYTFAGSLQRGLLAAPETDLVSHCSL